MKIRTDWDIYEEAILLCYYLNKQNGTITNEEAKSDLSCRLRNKAIKQGVSIDETYRNENGMLMKLGNLLYLFTEGQKGLSSFSKLDEEIYNLYKSDYSIFLNILKKGMEMTDPEGEIVQVDFNNQLNYSYSVPVKCILFNKELQRTYTGWSPLYVQILKEFKIQYPKIIIANTYLTETKNRIDIVDESKIYQLRRFAEIDTNLYVEVNLSADDIISRIRYLIKLCGLNNNDLELFYVNKKNNSKLQKKASSYSEEEIKKNNPALYMRLKSMATVYDDLSGFDLDWIKSKLGLSITNSELKQILNGISWIVEIREGYYSFSKKAKKQIDFDKEGFLNVLMKRYQKGIQFDSIDLENFRETYTDITGKSITLTDKELETCLVNCGIVYKDRVFPAEGIINDNAKKKLMNYIINSFNSGKKVLYYNAIYSELADVFSNCYNLADSMMLKAYIEYVCEPGEYFFEKDYMSKQENIKINHASEIENYLLSKGKPLSYEELYDGLSNISQDIINAEIRKNPNILLNERGHYFHYDIFELSLDDEEKISNFINEDIEENGYCIWAHTFSKIQQSMPMFLENNAYLSSLGIRKAIEIKVARRFSFEGEVICKYGHAIDMISLYRMYGEHHAHFTSEDIYNFSKEINSGGPYLDTLAEVSVRVSKDLFVAKEHVNFDIVAIDNAISTYLSKDYIPIKEIDSFLIFPYVGFEWNIFLLESYLIKYSKKYKLLNNGRSLSNVAGVVVKKGNGFSNFVDVSADYLAKSNCSLEKEKVLNYLAEMNFITRRSCSKIEEIITKAKQIRNRKVI